MKLLEKLIDYQGWKLLRSEEEFKREYPEPKAGQYGNVPRNTPDEYPCLFKEVAYVCNSDRRDEDVLAYIYLTEEEAKYVYDKLHQEET